MAKIYQSVAVIFFNVSLFLVLAVVGLWAALEIRTSITGRGQVVISDAIKFHSYSLTPENIARETAAEFDAYASTQPFVFNPWTTFMLAPTDGQHLNVVEGPLFNHRFTPPPTPEPDGPVLTIWSFGGSTLYGFGVPDNQTIPHHLQQFLNDSDLQRRVEVVNFGTPYWFSTVELAAFNAMLSSDNRPDIVIFLDGLNDLFNLVPGRNVPFFTGQGHAAWERRRNDSRRLLPWLSINESFPPKRAARFIQYKTTGLSDPENFRQLEAFTPDQIVAIMSDNIKKATTLSRTFDVKPFFFLQPVPWYGSYAADDVNTDTFYGDIALGNEIYERLIDHYDQGDNAAAFHDLLWSHESPFVDNIHYSDSANRLIARRMADVILSDIVP